MIETFVLSARRPGEGGGGSGARGCGCGSSLVSAGDGDAAAGSDPGLPAERRTEIVRAGRPRAPAVGFRSGPEGAAGIVILWLQFGHRTDFPASCGLDCSFWVQFGQWNFIRSVLLA